MNPVAVGPRLIWDQGWEAVSGGVARCFGGIYGPLLMVPGGLGASAIRSLKSPAFFACRKVKLIKKLT